jgi:accessory colonization factor AcfC
MLALWPALLLAASAASNPVLHVYGPGGPAPAIKEAAEAFGKTAGVRVEVTAGPTDAWIERARADADVIYSGAEYMMTDLVAKMEGRIDESSIVSLYLRPAAILVRPGNPKQVKDLPDLLRPGMKVLVVQGAGQTGLWEDMIGRTGDITKVRQLRRAIVAHAPNTGEAKRWWTERPELDAWIVYNIWQVSNPTVADLVTVSEPYRIYRSCGVALTRRGGGQPTAERFTAFLASPEGGAIFKKWGWTAP